MRAHHVAIQVQDLERARAFYVGVLGLPEVRRQPHSIWVDAEGLIVMLERADAPKDTPVEPWKSPRPGLHLLAFTIAPGERARWQRKLEAAGHAVEGVTSFTLYTRDPDGTRIGLSSFPDAEPPTP